MLCEHVFDYGRRMAYRRYQHGVNVYAVHHFDAADHETSIKQFCVWYEKLLFINPCPLSDCKNHFPSV